MDPIRLMTLAPGHFHAALVQKRMLPGIDRRGLVFGPLDRDVAAHVDRIASFNTRAGDPTTWELDVHSGPDWLDQFAAHPAGNVVVLAGRNRDKITLMEKAVSLGHHVLADKPWVVESADFPRVEPLLRAADDRGLLVWDMMTERHEVTNALQRDLIRKRPIFGDWQPGTVEEPALMIESVHYLKKMVAGRPLVRPWWWFDSGIAGESMADVGTHLADLAIGFLAPGEAVNYQQDIQILAAERWPLPLSEPQFAAITSLPGFPSELRSQVINGELPYAGNNAVSLTLRGVHVKLVTRWGYESEGAGDLHTAIARGTRATVAIHQSPELSSQPEVFVTATNPLEQPRLVEDLREFCRAWQSRYPGLRVRDQGDLARLEIPRALRIGHEAHFAEVLEEFLRYHKNRSEIPAWERPNLLAKYFLTTSAVDRARQT